MRLHYLEKIFLGLLVAGLIGGVVFIWAEYSTLKEGEKPSPTPLSGVNGTLSVPTPGSAKNEKETIEVVEPLVKQKVNSPVDFSGKAKAWYFEGSFPVRVYDEDGTLLGAAVATAQSDWMTAEFVEFKGSVSFGPPQGKTGTMMFMKNNPSGLPENDESFVIPIIFK